MSTEYEAQQEFIMGLKKENRDLKEELEMLLKEMDEMSDMCEELRIEFNVYKMNNPLLLNGLQKEKPTLI